MTNQQPDNSQIIIFPDDDALPPEQSITRPSAGYARLVEAVNLSLSENSRRIYTNDLMAWSEWAVASGYDPAMPMFESLSGYMAALAAPDAEGKVRAQSTIQRMVSAVRKLAAIASAIDLNNPGRRAALDSLKLVKVKVGKKSVRPGKALTAYQALRAIAAWHGETPTCARNRAVISLLLTTGLRRSELAALVWGDIDLDNGVVVVRDGKGGKTRATPIAGELAIEALILWREYQCNAGKYKSVFVRIHRGQHIGADVPLCHDAIYRICIKTGELIGESFKPHDLRRTFITEALNNGIDLATVADVAGHKNVETTQRYHMTTEAGKRRPRFNKMYGG